MRYVRSLPLFIAVGLNAFASAQDPMVQSIIDAVSIDSMMADLAPLSGETTVDVGDGPVTITSRNKSQPGNALAATWLQQRFQQLGYTATVQIFSAGTGENIIVEIPGVVHPERKVVICGHYDSMPGGPVASPAADDDGSGTVAVLEALRVMAGYDFENTLVFALWDEEEQGKLGSIYYAGVAAASDVEIVAVVNMDAISYDGDGDGLMRVHTRNIANSVALKDTAVMVNETYAGLQLPMAINLPGATYSDHASFWSENYSAILVIEDFDNDGNPHYHTSTDLIEHIDQPYFHGLARLSIGTAAVMARPVNGETDIHETSVVPTTRLFLHPNPSVGHTVIRWEGLEENVRVEVSDALGRPMFSTLPNSDRGRQGVEVDVTSWHPGSYMVRCGDDRRSVSAVLMRTP
jgi:Peptidase family M28